MRFGHAKPALTLDEHERRRCIGDWACHDHCFVSAATSWRENCDMSMLRGRSVWVSMCDCVPPTTWADLAGDPLGWAYALARLVV